MKTENNKIKIICTRKGALKAYYYSRSQMRWFPMGLVTAQEMIKTGAAIDVTADNGYVFAGREGPTNR